MDGKGASGEARGGVRFDWKPPCLQKPCPAHLRSICVRSVKRELCRCRELLSFKPETVRSARRAPSPCRPLSAAVACSSLRSIALT